MACLPADAAVSRGMKKNICKKLVAMHCQRRIYKRIPEQLCTEPADILHRYIVRIMTSFSIHVSVYLCRTGSDLTSGRMPLQLAISFVGLAAVCCDVPMLVRLKIASLSLRIRRAYMHFCGRVPRPPEFLTVKKTNTRAMIFFFSRERGAVTICFPYTKKRCFFKEKFSLRKFFFRCFLSSSHLQFFKFFFCIYPSNFSSYCQFSRGNESLLCLYHQQHLTGRYRLDKASIRRAQIALSEPSNPLKPPRP